MHRVRATNDCVTHISSWEVRLRAQESEKSRNHLLEKNRIMYSGYSSRKRETHMECDGWGLLGKKKAYIYLPGTKNVGGLISEGFSTWFWKKTTWKASFLYVFDWQIFGELWSYKCGYEIIVLQVGWFLILYFSFSDSASVFQQIFYSQGERFLRTKHQAGTEDILRRITLKCFPLTHR